MSIDGKFNVTTDKGNTMGIDGKGAGRRKIEYKYTGQFDPGCRLPGIFWRP